MLFSNHVTRRRIKRLWVYTGQLLPITFSIQLLLSFFSPSEGEGRKKKAKHKTSRGDFFFQVSIRPHRRKP